MSSKLTLALFVTAVLMTLIVAVSLPAASALTARSTFNDNHCTSSFSCGQKICGDHRCGPGEYAQYVKALSQAQMTGKNAPSAPTTPSATMPPTTTMPSTSQASGVSDICKTVKDILTNEATPPSTIAKLLAALGCK